MITAGENGVYIDVRVQAKARHPGVRGVHGERLKIAVAEPADAGRANKATVQAVADLLQVPTRSVSLVAGRTSREKRLYVEGLRPEEALKRIGARSLGD